VETKVFRIWLAGDRKRFTQTRQNKQDSTSCGEKVIRMTTQEKPDDATHWSRSLMSKAVGISESTVGRIWKANGLSHI
jgi:DNA-binding MurR/RpiR family transcriptional regulator